MPRAATLAAIALLTVLGVACGGGGGAADADPATAVPRTALFYSELVVRPEGDLREDALAAAGKVLRTANPEAKLRELLDKAMAEADDQEASYERDVKPWLGERASLWISKRIDEAGEPGVGAAIAATDLEKAESSFDESRERQGGEPLTERTHRDVGYKVDEDGFAAAFVEDLVLFGDEPEVKQMIDALEGGATLAEDERYRNAIDGLDDARLAHVFLDAKGFFDLAAQQDPESAEAFRQLEGVFSFDRLPPVAGAFMADGDRLALDFVASIPSDDLRQRLGVLAWGSGSTPLMGELPGDSWLAQGMPKFGDTMRLLFDQFAGAIGGAVAKEQLQRQLGLDLEQDVFSWVGDVAVFVRGDTVQTVDGGVVIGVTDEDRAASAFGKIVGAVRTRGGLDARPVQIDGAETAFAIRAPEAPRSIVLARGEGKVVATYGEEAAAAALNPGETLEDSELYGQAQSVLGDGLDPSMVISVPAIVSLVESSGSAGAEWEQARPYVEAFTVIASGGGGDGNVARGRVAAGLK